MSTCISRMTKMSDWAAGRVQPLVLMQEVEATPGSTLLCSGLPQQQAPVPHAAVCKYQESAVVPVLHSRTLYCTEQTGLQHLHIYMYRDSPPVLN
jgi:hypothetical protein